MEILPVAATGFDVRDSTIADILGSARRWYSRTNCALMSIVVERRECRICPCTSLGLAPASTIHVACEVRRQRQLIQGRPSLRAAGLMCRDKILLSRIGAP